MASESGNLLEIQKLNGENYRNWSFRVKNTLKYKKLWKCITCAKVEDVESDEQALSLISLACNDTVKDEIVNAKTAKEAWNTLKETYVRKTPAAKVALYCQLVELKCESVNNTMVLLEEFNVVVRKLQDIGVALDDEMYSIILLRALPPSFEQFRIAVLTRDELPKLVEVRAKIEEEHLRQTNYNINVEPIVNLDQQQALLGQGMVDNRSCFKCGNVGHIMRNCAMQMKGSGGGHQNNSTWNNRSQNRVVYHNNNNPSNNWRDQYQDRSDLHNNNNSTNNWGHKYPSRSGNANRGGNYNDRRNGYNNDHGPFKYAMFASAFAIMDDDNFIIDSGCSSHYCRDQSWFVDIRPHREMIRMPNGSNVMCKYIGTVEIAGDKNVVQLKNVLYVPEFTRNFISVFKVLSEGYDVWFKSDGLRVSILKGRTEIASGRKEDGLFVLNLNGGGRMNSAYNNNTMNSELNNINSGGQSATLMEWHRKLGHLNTDSILKMSRENLVVGLNITSQRKSQCDVCIKCKITEESYPVQAQHRASEALYRVHSDVCEMPSLSYGGAKYFVTFIDDYSRYVKVYPLKAKSDVFECWLNYKNLIENQIGHHIKVLRSDNGGEYVSNKFKRSLEEAGITHETSVPHSPSQNGVAERMNRVIEEMVRCMLLDGCMPHAAWAEAVQTAVYIRNRAETSALNGTPFEHLYGRKPQMGHMMRFGANVVALKKGIPINKLSPKGEPWRFCGYAPTQKGYRLVCPQTGRLIVSRDCRFIDEIRVDGEVQHGREEEVFEDCDGDVAGPSGVHRRNPGRVSKSAVVSYKEPSDSDEGW